MVARRHQPAGIPVTAQRRRLAVHAVPRQLRQPPRRDRRHIHVAHPEGGDLLRALQCPLHLRARHPYRTAPQPVQLRDPLAGRHAQQRVQHSLLTDVQQPVQRVPQPLVRRLADRGHSLVSVVTPGSSTRRSRSQSAAVSNDESKAAYRRSRWRPAGVAVACRRGQPRGLRQRQNWSE